MMYHVNKTILAPLTEVDVACRGRDDVRTNDRQSNAVYVFTAVCLKIKSSMVY